MSKNIAYGLGILLLALFLYMSVFTTTGDVRTGISKGSPFPDFKGKTIDGREIDTSSLRGKIVLVNFWATWCPPCRSEMPLFQRVYGKYRDQGFEIIGVSTDSSVEVVRKFVREYRLTFPIVLDENDLSSKLRIGGLPTSFLIDRDGRVLKVRLGEYREIEKDLRKLLVK